MKLQIDFDKKIIRVESSVKLDEFFNKLEKIIPSEEWKDYELEMGITTWVSPVIINPVLPYSPEPAQPRPWENPFHYSTSTGIGNFEIE